MEPLTFAALYIAMILVFVFIMLFGESELFANTPVASAHWLITIGTCQGIEWSAGKLCGERGRRGLSGLEAACCERSNPLVQLLFLVLLGGAFHMYWRDVFPMLPLPGLPAWHRWTGSTMVGVALAFFLAASLADPGYITPHNAHAHRRLYPSDGVLFEPGAECWTCGLEKPARSKHCKACGRCVARFDHHCVWVNNCVGLLNMRWFLAYLLSTAALCAYGSVLGILAVRQDMRERDAWSMAYLDRETGRLVFVGDGWRQVVAYVAGAYTGQVALIFFLGVAGWIVFGFCVYQLVRIMQGVTTNESFKRREYARAVALQRHYDAQRAQQDAITDRILAGAGGREAGSSSSGAGSSTSGNGERGADGHSGGGPGFKAGPSSSRAAGASATGQAAGSSAPRAAQGTRGGCWGRWRGGAAGKEPQSTAAVGWALPNNYNRGPWQNLHEVLFPWHHLQQAGTWSKKD